MILPRPIWTNPIMTTRTNAAILATVNTFWILAAALTLMQLMNVSPAEQNNKKVIITKIYFWAANWQHEQDLY